MAAKKINLALQGGGALGTYSWGVLDRLLEEKDVIIEGISGTSAGAMNAAILVNGYMKGGREGARQALEIFWRRVSETATAFNPLHKTPLEKMLSGWTQGYAPAYSWFDLMSRVFSPYETNPLNINPMRFILEDTIDSKKLQAFKDIRLFITATHIASGQARVFRGSEVSPDVLLASACIPFMFQAVEIEGEYYWDGGYMGNPAIWPLIYHCRSEDVVLVQINPIHDDKVPRSAYEIINRLNEITFNSSLVAEMRAIDFVSRLLHDGRLPRGSYKDMRIHLIYSQDKMHDLSVASKMNTDWDFFLYLKDLGRQAATQWLKQDWEKVGRTSSINIRRKFLCGPGSQPYQKGQDPLEKKKKSKQDKQKKVKKRK